MKRSGPLKRRKGLKPGGPLKRKKRINRVNPKTAKIRRTAADPRKRYVQEHFTCQCCHKKPATECHEIVTRAKSAETILYRCTYLAVCHDCHQNEMADYSRWPLTRQLAQKLVSDPRNFCLETINKLRGRAKSAITLEDVAVHLEVR